MLTLSIGNLEHCQARGEQDEGFSYPDHGLPPGDVCSGEYPHISYQFLRLSNTVSLTEELQTFMSMGLFNWHPKEGEPVLSPWWYIYFIVAGGLTTVVFILYFCWSRITEVMFLWNRKLDRHVV